MDEKTKEIRRVLQGNLAYDESGMVLTSVDHFFQARYGFLRGADWTRTLGLHTQHKQYRISGNLKSGQEDAVRAMLELGRQVLLKTSTGTMAILYRPIWGAPAVLTLDEEGNQLLFGLYMANSPLVLLYARDLLKKWELVKPPQLREVSVTLDLTPKTKKKTDSKKKASRKREEPEEDFYKAKHGPK